MIRMKTAKTIGLSPMSMLDGGGHAESAAVNEWELRPGGMLVQKRNLDSDRTSAPPPTIRVRVKYGSVYHEINISSQGTFGELKKLLTGPTGLHHEDQKLMYKDKERDSKAFLDVAGVKDRSKLVLVEDAISQEKRLLEMRRNAKMEKASKSVSEISFEVDRLAGQVSALESVISKGGKVAEKVVLNLIELLMNQLLKLDGIIADGDVKLQRKMQVKRVQKYVETLDMLKIKNSMPDTSNGEPQQKHSNGQGLAPIPEQPQPQRRQQTLRHSNGHRLAPIREQEATDSYEKLSTHQQSSRQSTSSGPVVVTTKWETFDSLMPVPSSSSTSNPATNTTTTTTTNNNNSEPPKFPWEFFD